MAKKYTPIKAKNIRRIRRFIKSAEKRGFIFPENIKQQLPQYSTQKLKSLTPEKLYKQAQYKLGDDITISAERGRQIERTLAAKKGTRKRLINKYGYEEYLRRYEPEAYGYYKRGYDEYQEYEEEEYIPSFTDIVLNEIQLMIEEAINNPVYVGYNWTTKDNGELLKNTLQSQISAYGRDAVAQVCENAPDEMKARARLTLQASSDYTCHAHIDDIVEILTGEILTQEQSKEFTADV